MPAKHGERPLQPLGLRGMARIEHTARLFLVNPQATRQLYPGNAGPLHLQVERGLERCL